MSDNVLAGWSVLTEWPRLRFGHSVRTDRQLVHYPVHITRGTAFFSPWISRMVIFFVQSSTTEHNKQFSMYKSQWATQGLWKHASPSTRITNQQTSKAKKYYCLSVCLQPNITVAFITAKHLQDTGDNWRCTTSPFAQTPPPSQIAWPISAIYSRKLLSDSYAELEQCWHHLAKSLCYVQVVLVKVGYLDFVSKCGQAKQFVMGFSFLLKCVPDLASTASPRHKWDLTTHSPTKTTSASSTRTDAAKRLGEVKYNIGWLVVCQCVVQASLTRILVT